MSVLAVLLAASVILNLVLLAISTYALNGWAVTIKDWVDTLDKWDASDAELAELLDQVDEPTSVEGAS